MKILKYPRTRHIEGSRLQKGDLGDKLQLSEFAGLDLIIEEKLDGANSAISFDRDGQMRLQSRGHYLTGGGRERHFALMKTWANVHAPRLHAVLSDRFIMYGEWMFAKHTVFYDSLPHFFLEFDVWDRQDNLFLSTKARRALLTGLPVMPVPVLHQGPISTIAQLQNFVGPSLYKTAEWRARLEQAAVDSGSRMDFVLKQTEDSDLSEGLYVKYEAGGEVKARFKYVRPGFKQAMTDADGHWHDRPILPNELSDEVDLFAPVLGIQGAYDDAR